MQARLVMLFDVEKYVTKLCPSLESTAVRVFSTMYVLTPGSIFG